MTAPTFILEGTQDSSLANQSPARTGHSDWFMDEHITHAGPVRSFPGTFCWHCQGMPAAFSPLQGGIKLGEYKLGAARKPPGPPRGKNVPKKKAKLEEVTAERDCALGASLRPRC